eukprot:9267104-Heterocapsa_arctica.AAC.1
MKSIRPIPCPVCTLSVLQCGGAGQTELRAAGQAAPNKRGQPQAEALAGRADVRPVDWWNHAAPAG